MSATNNNAGCKCEGLPPCMTSGNAAKHNNSTNNGGSQQKPGGGCPADYNNGGGKSRSNGNGGGGCPSCAPPPPPPPQPSHQAKCKPPPTPQAKPDPAQTLFDRYNLCCPGQKCAEPEPGPQVSTGRKLKKHKNGFDLYDSDVPRPSC